MTSSFSKKKKRKNSRKNKIKISRKIRREQHRVVLVFVVSCRVFFFSFHWIHWKRAFVCQYSLVSLAAARTNGDCLSTNGMNDKFDGLVQWSLSKLPSNSNSRWLTIIVSSCTRSSYEIIDFGGAGPKLQHVCINENYGGGAQDGRRNSKGISKCYWKNRLLSRHCGRKRSGTKCKYHLGAGALWIGAINHQEYLCVVVCQQKKWGGDEPHRFTVVCSRAWPEKAKMLALTNRSICGQDPGWSWWLRLRLFRGLKVAPTPTSNRIRIVSGASCWAKGTKVQNMKQHQQYQHRYCPI